MGLFTYDVIRVSANCFEVVKADQEKHTVIYHPKKDFWTCDCEWATHQIGKNRPVTCKHCRLVWRSIEQKSFKER